MNWTIQLKMVALFSIIVFIGFSALLIISYRVTEDNMYQMIQDDMIDVKTNLDIAVDQYFLIHRKRMSATSLAAERFALAKEVGSVIGGSVILYRPDGKSFGNAADSLDPLLPDLASAVKQEVAYATYMGNEQAIASLSFPLKVNHSAIGILRYQRDYSELYQRNLRFQKTLQSFAAVVFVFIFIASVFISRTITKPIRELTVRSAEVAQGNLNGNIQIRTQDEIGELAASFTVMINRIREQIGVIERERDEVKQVQARSKIFFDNVTHELKTPLTTILGYAQILKENGFADQIFFDKGLNYIIKESQRLNGMVVDILELAVAESPDKVYRMAHVDLSALIREACEDMLIKARKYNIGIDSSIEGRLVLQGDRERLKEAFINVLDNSIKYGHVNSIIRVQAYKSQASIKVLIRDQGEGIRPEALKRVLEPFYRDSGTIKVEKGSAGLGLSIVKATIEYHGGTIGMSSRLQEGTLVTISLPEAGA
ncbi:two-component sensor histidine kinase [Paenibacillus sp. BIHB 4019]|uniref:histidine kinase n=1 Tax=Paenibacillus sp. BIHB 4019 TaxID=1870819 RepID=A0A1B2DNN6_9BACL|nr:HAMP domain-containing sensor histidine kinase [Paenibacillus sp. BIHB 4019]ANY69329.1 two-component sensor histidine kinase [Paenibacillus sp. BIHB 4019]